MFWTEFDGFNAQVQHSFKLSAGDSVVYTKVAAALPMKGVE